MKYYFAKTKEIQSNFDLSKHFKVKNFKENDFTNLKFDTLVISNCP